MELPPKIDEINALKQFNKQENRKLIALVLWAFLMTFSLARLIVYLIVANVLPNFFLEVRGVHIHHFSYGVVILCLVGFYLLLGQRSKKNMRFAALWYGLGLGLTFDEFGMWVRLEDNYWLRQSYDAVIIVALLLLNIAYFKPFIKILYEIFYSKPKKIIKKAKEKRAIKKLTPTRPESF